MKLATIIVIVVGIFFRLSWLDDYPTGFNSKEAKLGLRGKLLSQTLIDETGRKLPLFFTSFDGYQFPFSSYLVAISSKILGTSEFSVRLPFAILGSLTVVIFYLIAKSIFINRDKEIFWSTVAFGLSPGSIFLARTTSEWSLLFNFVLILVYLTFFFGKIGKIRLFSSLIIVLVTLSWMFWNYFSLPGAAQKFKSDNFGIMFNTSISSTINQARGEEIQAGSSLVGKLFFNKLFYGNVLLRSIFDNLNPRLYFAAGDGNPLHGLSNFGVFPIVLLPMFLLGFLKFFQSDLGTKWKALAVLTFILLITPSILDRNSPNQEKLIFSLPLLSLVVGYGAGFISKNKLRVFLVLVAVNLSVIAHDAVASEPTRSGGVWQNGAREASLFLSEIKQDYDKVYLSDRFSPDIGSQLVFYMSNTDRLGIFGPKLWIDRVDNITIGNWSEWKVVGYEKVLFVLTEEEKKLLEQFGTKSDSEGRIINICYRDRGSILDSSGNTIFFLAENVPGKCEFNFHDK